MVTSNSPTPTTELRLPIERDQCFRHPDHVVRDRDRSVQRRDHGLRAGQIVDRERGTVMFHGHCSTQTGLSPTANNPLERLAILSQEDFFVYLTEYPLICGSFRGHIIFDDFL